MAARGGPCAHATRDQRIHRRCPPLLMALLRRVLPPVDEVAQPPHFGANLGKGPILDVADRVGVARPPQLVEKHKRLGTALRDAGRQTFGVGIAVDQVRPRAAAWRACQLVNPSGGQFQSRHSSCLSSCCCRPIVARLSPVRAVISGLERLQHSSAIR